MELHPLCRFAAAKHTEKYSNLRDPHRQMEEKKRGGGFHIKWLQSTLRRQLSTGWGGRVLLLAIPQEQLPKSSNIIREDSECSGRKIAISAYHSRGAYTCLR